MIQYQESPLVLAAPELLAIAKDVLSAHEQHERETGIRIVQTERVRAVVNKADGR